MSTLIERTDCHAAQFTTSWPKPDLAVIAAHGDLDAANAQDFVEYALRNAATMDGLVVDLSGVEFFGTAGFSALHTLNVRCAAQNIVWALAASEAVTRLLRICDPDSTMPIFAGVEPAVSMVQGESAPLLKLVAKSR